MILFFFFKKKGPKILLVGLLITDQLIINNLAILQSVVRSCNSVCIFIEYFAQARD